MNFDELYPSKFLRASDLGRVPITVTIGESPVRTLAESRR
jgi:hypothetical protein